MNGTLPLHNKVKEKESTSKTLLSHSEHFTNKNISETLPIHTGVKQEKDYTSKSMNETSFFAY